MLAVVGRIKLAELPKKRYYYTLPNFHILGFMCLDTDTSAGNMGMLDMVVALQWVQVITKPV